jgi:hypothetical protein
MKIFLTIFSVLLFNHTYSQCAHSWVKKSNNRIDTLLRETNCLEIENDCKKELDIDRVVNSVRKFRIEGDIRQRAFTKLDSLRALPQDSFIVDKIKYIEDELSSQFQIVDIDSVGYAIYAMDTVEFNHDKIVIYAISSNFRTEWNEDYENWFFYFTKEFGIIDATYTCIWNHADPSCLTEMVLIDNCKIDLKRRDLFGMTKEYILANRFGK